MASKLDDSRLENNQAVQKELDKLEQEHGFRILSARDYGSKAWNLDSEKSDRDIAFVFISPVLDYAKIGGNTETISREIEFEGKSHSFMGWDIRKFARLLDNSNPTVIEFLKSPIVYRESDLLVKNGKDLFVELENHCTQNFKPIALFYHYRSMAKSNYNKYIKNSNDRCKKRFLYVIRGLIYSRYVEKTHKTPSVDFLELLEEIDCMQEDIVTESIIDAAYSLAEDKRNGKGSEKLDNNSLVEWIEREMNREDIDNKAHDIRGIETGKLNKVIEEIYSSEINF